MKKIFYTLLAATLLLVVGCSKEDGPKPPKHNEQTLLMYFPWSGNLTSFFLTNICEMADVLEKGDVGNCRVLVYLMQNATEGELFELLGHKAGKDQSVTMNNVDTRPIAKFDKPAFTTAEGIASILSAAKSAAPADRYAMSIGCHGMAWLPANPNAGLAEPKMAPLMSTEQDYWEHLDPQGLPITRWFGASEEKYRTDVSCLAQAIEMADLHLEYILFDDCYMSSIEVAYELRKVTDHLIASPNEIMAYGFPYARCGAFMLGNPDYEAICQTFYDFYIVYVDPYGISRPYGTIAMTNCAQLEALADVVKRINAASDSANLNIAYLQRMDGYNPTRFFDFGDYVRTLCIDDTLEREFEQQLERTIPSSCRRHTPQFYTSSGPVRINTYTGVTTSDPSISNNTAEKSKTAWWKATH